MIPVLRLLLLEPRAIERSIAKDFAFLSEAGDAELVEGQLQACRVADGPEMKGVFRLDHVAIPDPQLIVDDVPAVCVKDHP